MNPSKQATVIVPKIPHWAAAPKRISFGLERSGPKSIIAPIPMNSRRGIASEAWIPTLNSQSRMPATVQLSPFAATIRLSSAPDSGMLQRIAPKPIGSRSDGSICFLMAR